MGFMHDHTQKPKVVWCPLMKEVCIDGWTKSMGLGSEDGTPRPVCVRWRGVFINDPKRTPPIQEVFDCKDAWETDLLQQVAEETYQGAAATEGVRNRVSEQAGAIRGMGLAFRAMARKNGVTNEDIRALEKEDAATRKLLEGGKTVPPKTNAEGGDGNL